MGEFEQSERGQLLARIADQGQDWQFVADRPIFKTPRQLLDRPLELTVRDLRGLRMVDETSIVIKPPTSPASEG